LNPKLDVSAAEGWNALNLELGKRPSLVRYTKDLASIITITGTLPEEAPASEEKINDLLASAAKIGGTLPANFAEPVIRSFGGVKQYVFQQTYREETWPDAKPIQNAFIVFSLSDSAIYDITIQTVAQEKPQPPPVHRSRSSSVALAEQALAVDLAAQLDEEGRSPLSYVTTVRYVSEPPGEPSATRIGTDLKSVWTVRTKAIGIQNGCEFVLSERETDIDATTTMDIEDDVVMRRELLHPATFKIHIFDPNPINTLNVKTIQGDDWRRALEERDLVLRDALGSLPCDLDGDAVRICHIEGPAIDPPQFVQALPHQATPDLTFEQNTPELAAVMAYYHVSKFHERATNLGFGPLLRKIAVDVDAADASNDTTSMYKDKPEGAGSISLVKRKARYFAEDAEMIAHEYAHAILFRGTHRRFAIVRDFSAFRDSEAGPISEGFADYWALSSFIKQTRDHGHDPACFAEWIRGGKCVRSATAKATHDDFDPTFNNHINGQVWSGALFEILKAFNFEADRADKIILLGHLLRAFDGAAPTMDRIAEGIVLADIKESRGANTKTLCDAFAVHRINGGACCLPGGCTIKPGDALLDMPPQLSQLPLDNATHCAAATLAN
jgi:hypothetical protein